MDNYGGAVARAMGDTYTRVNIYPQNASWYSSVLFTNPTTQSVKEASFRIDGKTGNVKCLPGDNLS